LARKTSSKRTAAAKSRRRAADSAAPGPYITTAVHIPRATHDLLRRVAFKRALAKGGRASVSALLAQIVERYRRELEAEAKSA
jgi:hypothetical protein